MRSISQLGTALLLGAMVSACGGNKDTATTGQAGGEPAAATGTTGAMGDSGAMGGMAGAAGAAAGAAAGTMGAAGDLAAMGAGEQLAIMNASNGVELATSKAALDKLTNADAKSYARDMIREHQAMQGQADKLAKAANVTPGSPDLATQKMDKGNQMAQQLQAATKGATVDRQYIDGQVQAHQETLTQLQALQNASDSTVKSVATQALPKVQAHLERAQKIQQSLGGSAAAPAGAAAGAPAGAAGGAGATPAHP
jgi:putative membrane protein